MPIPLHAYFHEPYPYMSSLLGPFGIGTSVDSLLLLVDNYTPFLLLAPYKPDNFRSSV